MYSMFREIFTSRGGKDVCLFHFRQLSIGLGLAECTQATRASNGAVKHP